MNIHKNKPKIALCDLLRRRGMTLSQFIAENGITTYPLLVIRCDNIGVTPPDAAKFDEIKGSKIVSSPTEGVVVIDPVESSEDEFPVAEKTVKRGRRRKHDESDVD